MGRGEGCPQRVFSCSPCPPLTSDTGRALGFTRPSDVRVAGRLRHPWLRPAALPVSSVSGGSRGTKENPYADSHPLCFWGICQQTRLSSPPEYTCLFLLKAERRRLCCTAPSFYIISIRVLAALVICLSPLARAFVIRGLRYVSLPV